MNKDNTNQGGSADAVSESQPSHNQAGKPIAKKYPMSGKLKGSIYGSPEITFILASFEGALLHLHGKRPYYKPTSRAWYKHQDHIRLEAAQRIMDLKADEAVSDLATPDPKASSDVSNPPSTDTLDTILINYRIDLPDEALSHRAEYGEQEDTARNKAKAQLLDWKKCSERRAIEIHDLQQHIENLDIQCEEGNCKNCDSKRPKLKELEAALQKKLQGDVTL